MPLVTSSLPMPSYSGHSVFTNRRRHVSLSDTSTNSPQLIVDSRTCEMTSQPSHSMERLTVEQDLSPLQTAPSSGAAVVVEQDSSSLQIAPSSGAALAVEQESTCKEHNVPGTFLNPSDIPFPSTLEDSISFETRSKAVSRDDVCRHLDVNPIEPKSASVGCDWTVVESKELRISRGSVKVVNKATETASEVRRSRSFSRVHTPRDLRCNLNDTRGANFAEAEQPPPTSTKTARLRYEGGVTLRSLDSRETRMISGLLTSLAHGGGSRVTSTGCYKLVSRGKNRSLVDAGASDVSYNKPLVSLTPLTVFNTDHEKTVLYHLCCQCHWCSLLELLTRLFNLVTMAFFQLF